MSVLGVVALFVAVLAVVAGSVPCCRPVLPVAAVVAAGTSLLVTAAHLTGPVVAGPGGDALSMAESVVLTALTGVVVRFVPGRRAAVLAALVALAAATWLLRVFDAASPLEAVGACAFWGAGAALAAAVGGHLRHTEVRQARAVAGTRLELRLRLARDLHDYLAHDISEMVAHAQAGTVAGDPREALGRVEAAGQRALAMLDRTLDMLHHDTLHHDTLHHHIPLTPGGDLEGIREAAGRFAAAGPARVELTLEAADVPPETSALAYRVVLEGLTNIRRHAPQARLVGLRISTSSGRLDLSLTNDGVRAAQPAGRRGGTGLAALTSLVEAHGGELRAAAVPQGWSLTVRLPLAQSPEWPPASSSPTTRKASAAPSG
ncbi:sensor histidine kinase [Nonomuraea sp. NPDC050328]|uniref:sensor histidine kinase n=1 Tax=Nonomuraea sp. NPDC050328 TaxID=3364361 RepID=UPI0037B7D4EE